MLRAGPHPTLLELAAHATVPVINGLTSRSHPCQVMADVMTFEELKGPIKGRTIAWVGDANNVATSWVHAAARFGCKLRMACPAAFAPAPDLIAWARGEGADIEIGTDPAAAVQGADCVVTDVWVSMGDGNEKARKASLRAFQVDAALMARAKPDAIFMHCLPAHRGDEVTAEVIDGPQSAVWDEAENRLHVQKAILSWCLDPKARGAKQCQGRCPQAPWRKTRERQGMSEIPSEQRIELVIPADDLILPFQAEHARVTGRLVKLGPTVDTILSRHAYPEPVSKLLGEAVALTALLGASLKFEGKFILQASTDGPVDLLVADYQVPGRLRGYARFSPERVAALEEDGGPLLGQGHFAMTIDRGADTERYQGVVPLEGETPDRRRRHLFPPIGAAADLHPRRRGTRLSAARRGRSRLDLARGWSARAEAHP